MGAPMGILPITEEVSGGGLRKKREAFRVKTGARGQHNE